MDLQLPDTSGVLHNYTLTGTPIPHAVLTPKSTRTIYSAAHVVANPFDDYDPMGPANVDWDKTMEYRRYLAAMGIGIAEAMDTAQRGMGLEWAGALELIRRTKEELPDALITNGCGTDHLNPEATYGMEQVRAAYLEQVEAVQKVGGRIILMASGSLNKAASGAEDYFAVYRDVLSSCDEPVILHWLGEMFDPSLTGYWGSDDFDEALETVVCIIESNAARIDGIKISLLDAQKEIALRRRLPRNVKLYTGDDFNYPELIEGDDEGHSHALLGIFDPLAPAAAFAVSKLSEGNTEAFRATLNPTVPLARHIFRSPTRYYKTGVVFLAWLNGFQDHFTMLRGAQSARSLPYFVDCFKMADQCGILRDPDGAIKRMRNLLSVYGV